MTTRRCPWLTRTLLKRFRPNAGWSMPNRNGREYSPSAPIVGLVMREVSVIDGHHGWVPWGPGWW